MKKIMFNDRYGLTEAVINGTKTQTRRIINVMFADNPRPLDNKYSRYKIGEDVAVAMSYYDAQDRVFYGTGGKGNHEIYDAYRDIAGWKNKMFVKAELMPYRIRITDIRVERLQDISYEDCIKEGILHRITNITFPYSFWDGRKEVVFRSANDAFACLIDKVNGKDTWNSNPWVRVYDFELITNKKD